MKKTSIIVLICILIVFCLGTYACFSCDPRSQAYKDIIDRKENDGVFCFYMMKNTDFYTIAGDLEENNPEIMYIPPFYKGKEVRQIYCKVGTGALSVAQTIFAPSFLNVKKIYVSFLSPNYTNKAEKKGGINIENIFFPNMINDFGNKAFDYFINENDADFFTIYVNHQIFNDAKLYINDYLGLTIKENFFDKIFFINYKDKIIILQKANITYLFNYENSPNGGVFFIDNYGYGESIKNPPYDPIREGYTFEGWYKESECINKWNFETDTLPIVEYDEDGNPVEFIETKLYAKWIKN